LIKYRIEIKYDGSHFSGFQIQNTKRTVQGVLQEALSRLFKEKIVLQYSGRTDTGVHCEKQFISFESKLEIPNSGIQSWLNKHITDSIVVSDVQRADSNFNPRYDAKTRTYRYLFTNEDIPMYLWGSVMKLDVKPNTELFNAFRSLIEGTHDFKNFRKTGTETTTTVRTIYKCRLWEEAYKDLYSSTDRQLYIFEVVGNGFLRRMVRNIVGLLVGLFEGSITLEDISNLLTDHTQKRIHFTAAPAKGLCLVNVSY
jgi:tRNA pseudouridine38-40 synthase